MTAVCEKAHSGIIGSASAVAATMVRLRPKRSDSAPKQIPPASAPRFMTIAMWPVTAVAKPCCA